MNQEWQREYPGIAALYQLVLICIDNPLSAAPGPNLQVLNVIPEKRLKRISRWLENHATLLQTWKWIKGEDYNKGPGMVAFLNIFFDV